MYAEWAAIAEMETRSCMSESVTIVDKDLLLEGVSVKEKKFVNNFSMKAMFNGDLTWDTMRTIVVWLLVSLNNF